MKSTLFAVVITVCAAPILPTMLVAGLCILCFLSLLAKSIMDESFTWRVDVMGALVLALLVVFGISGGLFSYTMGKAFKFGPYILCLCCFILWR